jgi:hypothetical protein
MSPTLIVVIAIAALVIIGIIVTVLRNRERQRLQKHFGPEYDRQVERAGGNRTKAELELLRREKRIHKLDIRPLPEAQRDAFMDEWREVQSRFVDDPERSIALADALVGEVMRARGYPVEDFEQRAADISVDHPGLVENYRAAHQIALRHSRGQADTEDLRAAFIGYRSMFEELLRADAPELAHS